MEQDYTHTNPEVKNGEEFKVFIKTLMPSHSKITDYTISVVARDQASALTEVLKEWNLRTNPSNFQSIEIKKVNK